MSDQDNPPPEEGSVATVSASGDAETAPAVVDDAETAPAVVDDAETAAGAANSSDDGPRGTSANEADGAASDTFGLTKLAENEGVSADDAIEHLEAGGLNLDINQITPYFNNVSTAVSRLSHSVEQEIADRKSDVTAVRGEIAEAERKAEESVQALKEDTQGQLDEHSTKIVDIVQELKETSEEMSKQGEKVAEMEKQIEDVNAVLAEVQEDMKADKKDGDIFEEILEMVRNTQHLVGSVSMLERQTRKQASIARNEVLQNRKRLALVEAQLQKMAEVTGINQQIQQKKRARRRRKKKEKKERKRGVVHETEKREIVNPNLSQQLDPNQDHKVSKEEVAGAALYSIDPTKDVAAPAGQEEEHDEEEEEEEEEIVVDEMVDADTEEWLRKQELAPRREASQVVTRESMLMHCKDMEKGQYKQRMRAAVKIQRRYRKRLAARNWPECLYEITAEEQRRMQSEAEAFAARMRPSIMQMEEDDANEDEEKTETNLEEGEPQGGGGGGDPSLVRKVNTHQRMLAMLEASVNEVSAKARKDREEFKMLKDEMDDYLSSAEKTQQVVGLTKLRVEAQELVMTEVKKEIKVVEGLKEQLTSHIENTDVHVSSEEPAGGGGNGMSYVQQEEIAERLDALEGQLLMAGSMRGNEDDDDVGNLKEVEDKMLKLSEMMGKIGETAEAADLLARNLKKTMDLERAQKKGSMDEEVEAMKSKLADMFAGHQTLSSSVHRLQRCTNELLEKPDTGEDLSKIQGKLVLLWKTKADKDEVDRAITRAVDAVMQALPEPPGEKDGTFIGKQKLSCLSCDRQTSKVELENDSPQVRKTFRDGRLRQTQDLVFGGSLARSGSEHTANQSGLEMPLQTDRMFPYTSLHQSGANTDRDLLGDSRGRAMPHQHARTQRISSSTRGPGGFKPLSSSKHNARPSSHESESPGSLEVQVKLQKGFKGKKTSLNDDKDDALSLKTPSPSRGAPPMLPTPPTGRRLKTMIDTPEHGKEMGAWDHMPSTAGTLHQGLS